MTDIVGINWGSTAFRAYRIAPNGAVLDRWTEAAGVLALDKAGMAALMQKLRQRWPDIRRAWAAGMIGSDRGWAAVPYLECPTSPGDLLRSATPAMIGPLEVRILPGLACRRAADDAPDVLRGEEVELFGLISGEGLAAGVAALPGTHTKWVSHAGGRIVEFSTSMSGEMFDRLTAGGLLASIVEGEAEDGTVFRDAVRLGHARALGLGTLLFGARARVMRGALARADAASFLRGMLIGADIADARALHPELERASVPLIGNAGLSALYAAAMEELGLRARLVDGPAAVVAGFSALDRAAARADAA